MFRIDIPTRRIQVGVLIALMAFTAWVAHANGALAHGPVAGPQSLPIEAAGAAIAPQSAPRVEVAFVLDTTGSMSGLIDGAKRKIWSIANQLASGTPTPQVRMALVGYRDRGDEYVTRVHDLTDDIDAIYADLQAYSAAGGGDTPESVNQALHEAVSRLGWSRGDGVYRVIFLVGDAPPHHDYPDDVRFERSVRLARQRGIVVNTVQCGSMHDTTEIWRQIAAVGGGTYAAIRQDGGMLAMATPMDDELAKLSGELADTLVPYGADDERAELAAKRDRASEAPPATIASRLGFLSKLGGRLNAGRADLVDAIASGATSLADVPEPELPGELQALPGPAREAYVKEKLATRQRLQARIDALSRDRDAYVAAENARRDAAGEGDGFDATVMESVRRQAVAAGLTY